MGRVKTCKKSHHNSPAAQDNNYTFINVWMNMIVEFYWRVLKKKIMKISKNDNEKMW